MQFPNFQLLLVIGICLSVSGFQFPQNSKEVARVLLATRLSEAFVARLEKEVRNNVNPSQSERASLIPPLPDPDHFGPYEWPLQLTIPTFVSIDGQLDLNGTLEGLSQLWDDFNFFLPIGGLGMSWDLNLTGLNLTGQYTLQLDIDFLSEQDGLHHILGADFMSGDIRDVFFKFRAEANAPLIGKMSMKEFVVDFGFLDFELDGKNATLDGNPIDWAYFSMLVQQAMDELWTEETRDEINELVRCMLDSVINNCNAAELIAGGVDCLNLVINEECTATSQVTTSAYTTPVPTTESSGAAFSNFAAKNLYLLLSLSMMALFVRN